MADAIHAADKELGYSDGTFIAGKWHLGPFFNGSTPLDHGFDHMVHDAGGGTDLDHQLHVRRELGGELQLWPQRSVGLRKR